MQSAAHWEHFRHGADIGVRGIAQDWPGAFEQVALALTAVIVDPASVVPRLAVTIDCQAANRELLCYEWLNALIGEMAIGNLLFGRFEVKLDGNQLHATAWGEAVEPARHQPAVEVKGATMTCLAAGRDAVGVCRLQTVVDV